MDRAYISLFYNKKNNFVFKKSEQNVVNGIGKKFETIESFGSGKIKEGNYYRISTANNSNQPFMAKFLGLDEAKFNSLIFEDENGDIMNIRSIQPPSIWRVSEENFSIDSGDFYRQLFVITVKNKTFFNLDIKDDGTISSIREEL